MSMDTFLENFDNNVPVAKTALCYEVEGAEGLIPRSERTGFLLNWVGPAPWEHPSHPSPEAEVTQERGEE